MKKRLTFLVAVAVAFGISGCGGNSSSDDTERDLCPLNEEKTEPGTCGCDMSDDDSDGDGFEDCFDLCPNDPKKIENGICGCGVADVDEDGNTIPDCLDEKSDLCPDDDDKTRPGVCGCGEEDVDSDGDTVLDCQDLCKDDPEKVNSGVCGCGISDLDSDGDGVPDCLDKCVHDPLKVLPGICGCEVEDSLVNITDTDGDGTADCLDLCPTNPYKTAPGESGCDVSDSDGDGVDDPDDACPYNPNVHQIAEGDDKTRCNYVTENGEKVFEIWSSDDFKTLRKELETLKPAEAVGMPCDGNYKVQCTGGVSSTENTSTATKCVDGANGKVIARTACYGGCVVMPEADDMCMDGTKPVETENVPSACTETTSPSKLYDCCTAENFADQCGENGVLTCKDGMVRLSKACPAVCHEADCVACIPVAEDGSNAGVVGTCCDSKDFVESCDGNASLRCISGRVQRVECSDACVAPAEGAKYAVCTVMDEIEAPVLKVRMMRDIDMSEASDMNVVSGVGCSGAWKPFDLYRIDFNGNGKVIRFTDGSKNCAMNNSLFDFVHESRIHDLSLSYNLEGLIVGALARGISHSNISVVSYTGDVRLMSPVYDETVNELSGLANGRRTGAADYAALTPWSDRTVYSNVHVGGSLVNQSKTQKNLAAVVGYMQDGMMVNVKSSLDSMNCEAASCSGLVDNIVGDVRMSGISVEMKKMAGTGTIAGVRAKTGTGVYSLQNTDVHMASIEISKNVFNGIGQTTDAAKIGVKVDQVVDVSEKTEDSVVTGQVYGLTSGQLGNAANVDIEIVKASDVNVYALAGEVKGGDISESKVTLGSVTGKGSVALAKSISGANMTGLTVDFGSVDGASQAVMAEKVADTMIDALSWKQKDVHVKAYKGLMPAMSGVSISGSSIDLGSITADDGAVSGLSASMVKSGMLESTVMATRIDGMADVYGISESMSADSQIEYSGADMGEIIAGKGTASFFGTMSGTLADVALHADLKTVAPEAAEGEEAPAPDVYAVAKKLASSGIKDVVSMSRMFTYTLAEDGTVASTDEVKAHQFYGSADKLVADDMVNNWWYKRSDEHTAQTVVIGEDDKTPQSFGLENITDVLGSFPENSWTKRSVNDNGSAVELPWPEKKPAPVENPDPAEGTPTE